MEEQAGNKQYTWQTLYIYVRSIGSSAPPTRPQHQKLQYAEWKETYCSK